ncbi:MAG: hypothetical protein KF723_06600 [Rhizobiaceae bacterium]|nr:hypothetical protein [Rhizobiaceae bacterium]
MNTRHRKIAFTAEAVAFAVPSFALYVFFGSMLAGATLWNAYSDIAATLGVVPPEDIWAKLGAGFVIVTPIMLGFAAMLVFAFVGLAYLRDGGTGARRYQRLFWLGLVLALIPMSGTVLLGLRVATGAFAQPIYGLYVSGLPVLIPALHLLIEIRAGRVDGRDPTAVPASSDGAI